MSAEERIKYGMDTGHPGFSRIGYPDMLDKNKFYTTQSGGLIYERNTCFG